MRSPALALSILLVSCVSLGACSSDEKQEGGPTVGPQVDALPEFGAVAARALVAVATESDGLDVPRDLAFDPDVDGRLWVVNAQLSGTVIIDGLGTPGMSSQRRMDIFAPHFMNNPSSLAFGDSGTFATCGETRDEWNGGAQPSDDFMGPTLWSSQLDVFAAVNQTRGSGREGSHLDMLHESPWCMGIEHDSANAYFTVDGLHGEIVHFDFQGDHGPGGADHSNGIVRRFIDAKVTRVPGVPTHLALDHEKGILYAADTGGGRVTALDIATGTSKKLLADKEPLAGYSQITGSTYTEFARGLREPSGIALHDGKIFVGEHATGDIVAFDTEGKELARLATGAKGLMGIAFSADGKLHFVDAAANRVVRVDPVKVDGAIDRDGTSSFDGGGAACEAIENDGPDVVEVLIPTARPAAEGGTILDGRYQLTKIENFTGVRGEAGTGDFKRRETYTVKGGKVVGVQRFVTDAPKDDHLMFEFMTEGTSFRVHASCIEGAAAPRGGGFTVTSTGVVFLPAYVSFATTWTRIGD